MWEDITASICDDFMIQMSGSAPDHHQGPAAASAVATTELDSITPFRPPARSNGMYPATYPTGQNFPLTSMEYTPVVSQNSSAAGMVGSLPGLGSSGASAFANPMTSIKREHTSNGHYSVSSPSSSTSSSMSPSSMGTNGYSIQKPVRTSPTHQQQQQYHSHHKQNGGSTAAYPMVYTPPTPPNSDRDSPSSNGGHPLGAVPAAAPPPYLNGHVTSQVPSIPSAHYHNQVNYQHNYNPYNTMQSPQTSSTSTLGYSHSMTATHNGIYHPPLATDHFSSSSMSKSQTSPNVALVPPHRVQPSSNFCNTTSTPPTSSLSSALNASISQSYPSSHPPTSSTTCGTHSAYQSMYGTNTSSRPLQYPLTPSRTYNTNNMNGGQLQLNGSTNSGTVASRLPGTTTANISSGPTAGSRRSKCDSSSHRTTSVGSATATASVGPLTTIPSSTSSSVTGTTTRYNRRNNPELEKRRIHHCDFPGKQCKTFSQPSYT